MSPIRTVLVHVDTSLSSATRLLIAHELAAELGAEMTVLFATAIRDSGDTQYAAGAMALSDEASDRIERHEQHKRALRARLGEDGPGTIWGHMPPAALIEGFVHEAAFTDLVVLGQTEHDPEQSDLPGRSFLEEVIVRSGRPTLVVPTVLPRERIGKNVLVAWDGSAQSLRALSAALPLLQRAEVVEVVGFAPACGSTPFSGLSLSAFLRRHNVAATMRFEARPASVGRALGARAAAFGADLVVMGCFGHSRVRERVFGGTTLDMLRTMPAALLLSH